MESAANSSLLDGASVCCRGCGALLPDLSDLSMIRCGHCRTQTPLDGEAMQRLRQHAARLRRAEHKARSILREEMFAHLLPALFARMKVAIFGGIAILLVIVPVFMLLGSALLFGSADGADGVKIAGIAILLVDLLVAVVAFPVGFGVAGRMATRADAEAARLAKLSSEHVEATLAVCCESCGGQARAVAIGRQPPLPCPWCGAKLIVSPTDPAVAAVAALVEVQQTTAEQRLRAARVRVGLRGRSKFRLKLPGFELRGGIYESPELPDVWIGFERTDHGWFRRVELDRAVTIPGRVLFVRPAIVAPHAALCGELGLVRPPAVDGLGADLKSGFVVFADPQVDVRALLMHAVIRELLGSLDPRECLHVDPGGASCWSVDSPPKPAAANTAPERGRALARAMR
jgi:DNA-directed RNA polymerase subunit RPC12/RpoP